MIQIFTFKYFSWAQFHMHEVFTCFICFNFQSLREKCPNTEFFLVCIFTYSGWNRDLLLISPHSAGVWENTDQKKLWTLTLFKQWLGLCNPLTTNVLQIYKNQSIGLHCKLISIWWGTLVVNGVTVLTTKFIWLVNHVICSIYFCEVSSSQ